MASTPRYTQRWNSVNIPLRLNEAYRTRPLYASVQVRRKLEKFLSDFRADAKPIVEHPSELGDPGIADRGQLSKVARPEHHVRC
jgi:hypothetical protein